MALAALIVSILALLGNLTLTVFGILLLIRYVRAKESEARSLGAAQDHLGRIREILGRAFPPA